MSTIVCQAINTVKVIQTWVITTQAGILTVTTVLAPISVSTRPKGAFAALTSVVTLKYGSTSGTKISPRIKLNFRLSIVKLPADNPAGEDSAMVIAIAIYKKKKMCVCKYPY